MASKYYVQLHQSNSRYRKHVFMLRILTDADAALTGGLF